MASDRLQFTDSELATVRSTGKKMDAIWAWRARTGLGLREAMTALDRALAGDTDYVSTAPRRFTAEEAEPLLKIAEIAVEELRERNRLLSGYGEPVNYGVEQALETEVARLRRALQEATE